MTRILQLNARSEQQLLRARQFRDTEAERVAAKIIADVRRRGEAALIAWTKKLDRLSLTSENVWLSSTGATLLRPSLPGRKNYLGLFFLQVVEIK